MDNNDLLIRVRYALDIKNKDMIEIFKLGGIEVTKDELLKLLTKTSDNEDDPTENEEHIKCDDVMMESFLNGMIIFKRGKQDPKPGQPERLAYSNERMNNILLKKLKIALSLTSVDMLEILKAAKFTVTKEELNA